MASRLEILNQRLQRERQEEAELLKRKKLLKVQIARLERKVADRRKYIVGGHVLSALEERDAEACQRFVALVRAFNVQQHPNQDAVFEALRDIFNETLVTDVDRRAFELAPLPDAAKPKRRRRSQKAIKAAQKRPKTPDQPIEVITTLPPALVEATIASPVKTVVGPPAPAANDVETPPKKQPRPRLPEPAEDLDAHFNL
jgi:hypothetical protein